MENFQLSYNELEEKYNLLLKEQVGFLRLKQSYSDLKDRLDTDLFRFQNMQDYTRTILKAENLEEFSKITCESLIETFDLDCSAIFFIDNQGKLKLISYCDLEVDSGNDLYIDKGWDEKLNLLDDSVVINNNSENVKVFDELGIAATIYASLFNDNQKLYGLLLGGISKNKKPFYDDLKPELIPSFKVFVQLMNSLLLNFEVKKKLDKKVKERTREIEHKNILLRQSMEEIAAQRDFVEQKNLEINESIHYAKKIQTALLPQKTFLDDVLTDYFILYLPRNIVSGDFYWVTQINSNIIIAVADCTGHGVPGAFMSLLGISFITEIVQKNEITQCNLALNRLRNQIKLALHQTGKFEDPDDGMDISLCALNIHSKRMQYAGAYNPLYLFNNNGFTQVRADRMPVGYYPNEKPSFTNHEIQLYKGDVFYLFSDGFSDQFGGANKRKYKTKNFQNLLSEIWQKPMNSQKSILENELNIWMQGNEQTDDILIMGVKV